MGKSQKKPVWVNPDWSKAKVYTAQEKMLCFGLGCPSKEILPGDHYTLHRIKATGAYADRAFCTECHPVRQMPPGFDLRDEWYATMHHYDEEFYQEKPDARQTFGNILVITDGPDKGIYMT